MRAFCFGKKKEGRLQQATSRLLYRDLFYAKGFSLG